MKQEYKVKLHKALFMMSKKCGVPKIEFRRKLGIQFYQIKASLDKIGIKYSSEGNVKLLMNFSLARDMLEDWDGNLIALKYDYTNLLEKLKQKLLTPNECCAIIGCRNKDYRNVITYLSMKYPIYEEDDERVGYLE